MLAKEYKVCDVSFIGADVVLAAETLEGSLTSSASDRKQDKSIILIMQ